MAEDVRLDLTGVLADEIGPAHGISLADWRAVEDELERVGSEMAELRRQGRLEPLDLPYAREDLPSIRRAAERCRQAERLVVLGIGGSALGGRAVVEAFQASDRILFVENVDPETVGATLERIDPAKTIFNIVSKSGTTTETIAQLLCVWDLLESRLGEKARERVIITTDPQRGPLRAMAAGRSIEALEVPAGVGGRFSVLTAVGLLPAAVAGVDIEEMLAGAARMDERCRTRDWRGNPGLSLAAVHTMMDRMKGKNIAVLMPYADALRSFADWFCQLWAESLGKRRTPSGDPKAPVGQTPVRAVGATDQHSQLQLYVEGPNDKLLTLVRVQRFRRRLPIPRIDLDELSEAGLGHIAGHDLGELLDLQLSATEMVLASQERPVLRIDLPGLSAASLGQLFYMYEWATIAAGILYHVDPFDQPGVEEGKRLTHAALGQEGLEGLGSAIRDHRSRRDRVVV